MYNKFNEVDREKERFSRIYNLICSKFSNREIPDKYDSEFLKYANDKRGKIVEQQGFALLTNEWIDKFAKWIGDKKCLEIMAGCGSLSKVLKDKGVDVIATDNFSWNKHHNWNRNKNYWTDIENIDAVKAVEKYKDRDIIIMSWADMDEIAYKCLQRMRHYNPNMIMVVIGEYIYGCTANEDFFESIKEIECKEIEEINEVYPRWSGINDSIMLVK